MPEEARHRSGEQGASRVQDLILDQLKSIRAEQQNGFTSVRDEFNARFDKLVSRDAFNGEQQRVNDKFNTILLSMKEEQHRRSEAILKVEKRLDQFSANLRWVVAAVALPVILFVANLVVSLTILKDGAA